MSHVYHCQRGLCLVEAVLNTVVKCVVGFGGMKEVGDLKRYASPTVTPQALAWDGKQLWMSSRDLGTLYRTELDGLKIVDEFASLTPSRRSDAATSTPAARNSSPEGRWVDIRESRITSKNTAAAGHGFAQILFSC